MYYVKDNLDNIVLLDIFSSNMNNKKKNGLASPLL